MDLCIQVWITGQSYGSMYPGMDYRMDLWNYGSMYPGMDYRMDLCNQVWITGWIYGSMCPGMDYRIELWIYVSRYGLQDGSVELWIQVWITGWICGTMDLCIQVQRTVWSLLLRLEGGYKQLQSSLNIHRRLVSTPNQSSRSDLSPELHLIQLQVLYRQPRTLFLVISSSVQFYVMLEKVGEGIG